MANVTLIEDNPSSSRPNSSLKRDSKNTLTIRILYFARLADDAGRAEETIEAIVGTTAADLFEQLKDLRSLSLTKAHCRAAINETFVAWDRQLRGGDTLAFIPPVTGG